MALRPTFMGFEAAKRGLAVNQKGLDIVGNNLANVYTEGYTRQRLDQYAIAPGAGNSRYATTRANMAGQGVDISGVSQVRDSFLDKRFRDEYGDVGYYDQTTAILSDVEAAIGDPEATTDTGVKNALVEITKALSDFVSNADSKVHANVVATTFRNLTQTLHQFDAKLNNIMIQQKNDLSTTVNNINEITSKIQALNKTILDDKNSGFVDSEYFGPNELYDERNLLLDELAQYGNISVKENSDGTVDVEMAGKSLVKGSYKDSLSYREYSDGTITINWKSDGTMYSSPNGAVQAAIDMINGKGEFADGINDSMVRGIPYYTEKLDIFANTLMNTFNNIVPEVDADGNPVLDANGGPVYKQLLGASTILSDGTKSALGTVPAKASTITLSDEWTADSAYLIYREGDNSTTYPNMLLNALKNSKHNFSSANGVMVNMTFSDYVSDYSSAIGTDVSFHTGRHEATSSIASQMMDARDEVSAVSPEEETSNMLLYNKSFQAISRLMTTLDEALDKLINSTGLVGR